MSALISTFRLVVALGLAVGALALDASAQGIESRTALVPGSVADLEVSTDSHGSRQTIRLAVQPNGNVSWFDMDSYGRATFGRNVATLEGTTLNSIRTTVARASLQHTGEMTMVYGPLSSSGYCDVSGRETFYRLFLPFGSGPLVEALSSINRQGCGGSFNPSLVQAANGGPVVNGAGERVESLRQLLISLFETESLN